jgi:Ca2+/Na+ antiporter
MIIINAVRFLAVILFVSILIVKEIPFRNLFKDLMIQFYLALSCVLILLIIDNIFGFILSLCLLALYFRIYTSELKSNNDKAPSSSSSSSSGNHHNHHSKDANGKCTNDKCVMNMEHVGIERKKRLEEKSQDNSLVPYITEENLLAAQSNIVNPEEYNKEMQGVEKGIYNEDVYGSQGLDNKNVHMRGYDVNNVYLGSLSYDIW